MLLSERDADALRLICWCQFIRPKELRELTSDHELSNLTALGLIKLHKKSGSFVLTSKGLRYLQTFLPVVPELTMSYHEDAIGRRLRLSRLAFTAYRAGVDLFTTSTSALADSPSMFLASVTRSRGSNPWGSTRIAAIARLGNTLYAMHYVCPGIGKLALTDELTVFSNQTARFRNMGRAFIFAGDTYSELVKELSERTPAGESKLVRYGDAYRALQLPVHLLSLNDTGAKQLQLMSLPDYRRRLAKAALNEQYAPPPKDAPAWDALFGNVPFVMAADMDLRRIGAALKTAKERGCTQIVMAALEEQVDSLLLNWYGDTGKARVFTLKDEAVTQALGKPLLHAPSRTQFRTEKGEVVDAPLIQVGRKAGRSR